MNQFEITKEQITTLSQAGIIPAGTPQAIIEVFAHICKLKGLSPFKKEIYLVKRNTKSGVQYVNITSIDGYRMLASRTGQFAGVDDAKYDLQSDGSFKTAAELKASGKQPISCTITVYRLLNGVKVSFTKTCVFSEYYPSGGGFSMSSVMPFNMIAKCAEAGALRMGFSDELTGLSIEEELTVIEGKTIDSKSVNNDPTFERQMIEESVKGMNSLDNLTALYKSDPIYSNYADVFTNRKLELTQLNAAQ